MYTHCHSFIVIHHLYVTVSVLQGRGFFTSWLWTCPVLNLLKTHLSPVMKRTADHFHLAVKTALLGIGEKVSRSGV